MPTDVSGQPVGLIIRSQAAQEKCREQVGALLYRGLCGR